MGIALLERDELDTGSANAKQTVPPWRASKTGEIPRPLVIRSPAERLSPPSRCGIVLAGGDGVRLRPSRRMSSFECARF